MCEEEKRTAFVWGCYCCTLRPTLFPAPPLSPEHVLMLSSLFCREINVEEAPHPRERRAPQPRRKTLYCRTMWTDTHINTHINTNNWCWGFYTFTNVTPTYYGEKHWHSLHDLAAEWCIVQKHSDSWWAWTCLNYPTSVSKFREMHFCIKFCEICIAALSDDQRPVPRGCRARSRFSVDYLLAFVKGLNILPH